jgi:uncharacterized protein YggT (Ycf19 family)
MVRCTETTLCVCQSLWFSPGPSVSSTNKSDRHDIAEILLNVALNTIDIYIYLEYIRKLIIWFSLSDMAVLLAAQFWGFWILLNHDNSCIVIYKYACINDCEDPSWSWSCGSWIYNYLCTECLSPLKLWVVVPFGGVVYSMQHYVVDIGGIVDNHCLKF